MNANNGLNDDCALVIHSCDAYKDIWPVFFKSLKENWQDCSLDIYLNTETETFAFDGLNIVTVNQDHFGKGISWGKRLLELTKRINKPFVISLFDDFLLESSVNVKKIEECLMLLKNNQDIAVFYFLAIPGAIRNDGIHPDFNFLENFTDYKINSAPAIWRKSCLVKFTGENDNPWAWEVYGTARTYFEKEKFYAAKTNDQMVFKYNYALGGAIRRGKWVASVVIPLLQKYSISLDLNQRGFASESFEEGKHTLRWKLKFLQLGYEMVGARSVVFLIRAIFHKIFKAIR
jgi:hypothetical protein